MALSSKIRVAVLRGGPSHEYDVSLQTGGHVLSLLREIPEKYDPLDIFISRDGEWHREGLVHEPHHALRHVDVVWNGLHGRYGEDGKVQQILESLKIPFTGPSSISAVLAMDKEKAKKIYEQYGLLTPRHELIKENPDQDHLIYIFRNYLHPVIVKPASGGSSLGVRLAHTFNELEESIRHALEYAGKAIVEEFVRGKEGSCGVVENVRGESLYALLPVEIRKSKNKPIFDFDSKYSGEVEEVCPGNFKAAEKKAMENIAKSAHKALGLRHYSRSDFIVTPKSKVYILETNALPGFTQESLMPKSLKAVGWHPREFINHVLSLAL